MLRRSTKRGLRKAKHCNALHRKKPYDSQLSFFFLSCFACLHENKSKKQVEVECSQFNRSLLCANIVKILIYSINLNILNRSLLILTSQGRHVQPRCSQKIIYSASIEVKNYHQGMFLCHPRPTQ